MPIVVVPTSTVSVLPSNASPAAEVKPASSAPRPSTRTATVSVRPSTTEKLPRTTRKSPRFRSTARAETAITGSDMSRVTPLSPEPSSRPPLAGKDASQSIHALDPTTAVAPCVSTPPRFSESSMPAKPRTKPSGRPRGSRSSIVTLAAAKPGRVQPATGCEPLAPASTIPMSMPLAQTPTAPGRASQSRGSASANSPGEDPAKTDAAPMVILVVVTETPESTPSA